MEVRVRDAVGTDIDNRTNKMVLEKHGNVEEEGEGYQVLSSYSKAVFAYTYGVKNTSGKDVEVTSGSN